MPAHDQSRGPPSWVSCGRAWVAVAARRRRITSEEAVKNLAAVPAGRRAQSASAMCVLPVPTSPGEHEVSADRP